MTPEPTPPAPPSDAPDWELLGRFFAGASDPAEAARVSEWLAAHPDDLRVAEAVNAAASSLGAELQTPVDTESALAAVLARRSLAPAGISEADHSRRAVREESAKVTPIHRVSPLRKYAAAAAVLVVAGAWFVSRTSPTGDTRNIAANATAQMQLFATDVGERDSMRLPDGTRVILGPASTLRYAADYGFERRSVTLVGDGYFDVAPGQAAAFTVHAGPAVIVDLGTAFTVRSDDARGVLVAVTNGRVTLAADSTPTRTLELAAGDAGVLDLASGTARKETVAVDDATAWTTGSLVFRDAVFEDVASALRRWHGIVLQADSNVRASRLTATFTNEPKETVLETIALSYGAERVTHRDTVRLRMGGAGRTPR